MIDDDWRIPSWYRVRVTYIAAAITWVATVASILSDEPTSGWLTAVSLLAAVVTISYAGAATVVARRDGLRDARERRSRS